MDTYKNIILVEGEVDPWVLRNEVLGKIYGGNVNLNYAKEMPMEMTEAIKLQGIYDEAKEEGDIVIRLAFLFVKNFPILNYKYEQVERIITYAHSFITVGKGAIRDWCKKYWGCIDNAYGTQWHNDNTVSFLTDGGNCKNAVEWWSRKFPELTFNLYTASQDDTNVPLYAKYKDGVAVATLFYGHDSLERKMFRECVWNGVIPPVSGGMDGITI